MKASKFSDVQKAFILKQGVDWIPVAEICRRAGISHPNRAPGADAMPARRGCFGRKARRVGMDSADSPQASVFWHVVAPKPLRTFRRHALISYLDAEPLRPPLANRSFGD